MGSKRTADQRVIRNHPFCALCGSHIDLTVERTPMPVGHTVMSTVTGTTREVETGMSRPRVVCGSCRASHDAWLAEFSHRS